MAGRIKICGIRQVQDVEALNACKPDYAGFVFVSTSRRYVMPQKANELRHELNSNVITVGVFVNEKIENIAAIFEEGTIAIAQLHGSEDASFRSALKALCGVPIIQALRVDPQGTNYDRAALEAAVEAAAANADYVLFDALEGGGGQAFDWSLLGAKALQMLSEKGFLAGGININNIEAALKLHPFAIDVSSGVETDGAKDAVKMAHLVRSVRRV
ncbi:MAG: phosphoribosylanthranilate isomerase [Termitinemataceae bacterium]|nr:MAG: phosphoribosylanthranilate isomerase [Termitinemataceae bacterium]